MTAGLLNIFLVWNAPKIRILDVEENIVEAASVHNDAVVDSTIEATTVQNGAVSGIPEIRDTIAEAKNDSTNQKNNDTYIL